MYRKSFIFQGDKYASLNTRGGICSQPNTGNIIRCHSSQDKIEILNSNGEFLLSFGSKGQELGQLDRPTGICTLGSNILVADTGNKRIQIFDANGNPISSISTKCYPIYIATMSGGNIVISSDDFIVVFSLNGQCVLQFGSTGTKEGQFRDIIGIGVNSLDQIIASDSGNSRLQIFSRDGRFLRAIGPKGFNVFWMPGGIGIDEEDNMLVRVTHGIHIFSLLGLLIQEINIPPSSYFASLCISGRKIIVSATDSKLDKEIAFIFSNQ